MLNSSFHLLIIQFWRKLVILIGDVRKKKQLKNAACQDLQKAFTNVDVQPIYVIVQDD